MYSWTARATMNIEWPELKEQLYADRKEFSFGCLKLRLDKNEKKKIEKKEVKLTDIRDQYVKKSTFQR